MVDITIGKKNCSTCSLIINQIQKSINCLTCECWFHARTSYVKSPPTCQQTEIDILKFNPFDIDNNIFNNQHSVRFDNLTCNYHLPNDFTKNNTNDKNLSILNLNIRSLANKFDAFKNVLNNLNHAFSIISLTETWLNDETMQ
jgi:hypothetical protein